MRRKSWNIAIRHRRMLKTNIRRAANVEWLTMLNLCGQRPACFYLVSPGAARYYTFLPSRDGVLVPGQLPATVVSPSSRCPSAIRPVCPARLFAVNRGRWRQSPVCRDDNAISRHMRAEPSSLDCFRGRRGSTQATHHAVAALLQLQYH